MDINRDKIWNAKLAKFSGAMLTLLFMMGISITASAESKNSYKLNIPLGLDKDAFEVPKDNPMTKEKVELGHLLFFDKRLSQDNSIACSSCHIPQLAYTDGQPVSTGIKHQQGGRSAPTAINRGFTKAQFWDGRAATLEEQSVGPLTNPIEHGFANNDAVVAKINSINGYKILFKQSFGTDAITIKHVGKAIASFQRTLVSGNSPYDKFEEKGDKTALSESAKRGKELFFGKALCSLCHNGPNFSNEQFHNIGIGWGGEGLDVGRFNVTKDKKDIGAFKTPTLREISKTAPYMHDGSLATLEEVVDHYNGGGIKNPFLDNLILPLKLTDSEKKDLVEMLRSLNGEGWQHVKAPTSFPK